MVRVLILQIGKPCQFLVHHSAGLRNPEVLLKVVVAHLGNSLFLIWFGELLFCLVLGDIVLLLFYLTSVNFVDDNIVL